jgi:hypothetical protein
MRGRDEWQPAKRLEVKPLHLGLTTPNAGYGDRSGWLFNFQPRPNKPGCLRGESMPDVASMDHRVIAKIHR